ncbi:hypothetical protein P168DRAFT_346667 [Aspergillus campestris IBT 28561]|uniref:Uncharacterized protein n=1 Tax=Aspergillus campestris (strain IBT 28561) TaxID=1392248 RepID=A0A2I1CYW9_ASPC2|nr:uncharacterized protein P168DRAFT_346667 [Aspergillus campestris IBT 28561]PKY02829.1 hypothetical protein P168DRAFT_346667 [Aspergillus campestris IBT 28561]
MPADITTNTRDVRNLVNGDVNGDQTGGDKVAGNKLLLTGSDEELSEDLEKICQLVSSMSLKGLQTKVAAHQGFSVLEARQLRHGLERFHTLHYTGTLDTSKSVCEMRFSDLLPHIVTPSSADPQATLRYNTLMQNIRRRKGGIVADPFLSSRLVQRWAVDPCLSLACIQGSFTTRHILRDFASGMINLLAKQKIHVVWILPSNTSDSKKYGPIDIVKQLVSQILHQNPAMLNERCASLNAARSREAYSLDNWFDILGSVLVGVNRIYIVVDLEVLGGNDHKWSDRFIRLFDELQRRQVPTVVKPILLSCRKPAFTGLRGGYDISIDVSSARVMERLQSRCTRKSR